MSTSDWLLRDLEARARLVRRKCRALRSCRYAIVLPLLIGVGGSWACGGRANGDGNRSLASDGGSVSSHARSPDEADGQAKGFPDGAGKADVEKRIGADPTIIYPGRDPSTSDPVDPRPSPPSAWSPPGITLGSSGWKQSTTPLCEKFSGWENGYGVWADQRGVFALFSASCQLLDPGSGVPPCTADEQS